SEMPIKASDQTDACPKKWLPWAHLKSRPGDGWDMPSGSDHVGCHLMVQVMESWFIADPVTLEAFFGQGFKSTALPAANQIEAIDKQKIFDALDKATKNCKTKAKYGKGEHSFEILSKIEPNRIIDSSRWAKRFIDHLKEKMKHE
ncbi:MAG: DUF4276 family protein, partial [Bacteroidia bacterium]|nr:DUF4276 family protein [Bacteroidia bacterium]